MLVLGIETSCDETASAVVEVGKNILSNIIVSQHDLHSQYGGVYPELACRRHMDLLLPVIKESLDKAQKAPHQIDLISVAQGPGLIGALLLGVHAAKALSLAWKKPFVGVSHIEAHLYSALMGCDTPLFPALGVVLSGGHTLLFLMHSMGKCEVIGQTVDDAIGEAFDKVASLLSLSYPGGPQVESLACRGNIYRYPFKAGQVKRSKWDFSFSGIKTQVLYTVKGQNQKQERGNCLTEQDRADIAASFQEVVFNDVVMKAVAAATQLNCRMILIGGGVSANEELKRKFGAAVKIPVYWPPQGLTVDNGAMIAGWGYQVFLRKDLQGDPLHIEPFSKKSIDTKSYLNR